MGSLRDLRRKTKPLRFWQIPDVNQLVLLEKKIQKGLRHYYDNVPIPRSRQDILMKVIIDRTHKSIDRHLKQVSNVNFKDDLGITPLMWACYSGSLATVRKLVSAGADPYMCDEIECQCIDYTDHTGIRNFLLKKC